MKTCETCKGTGQVPEALQIGDIVSIHCSDVNYDGAPAVVIGEPNAFGGMGVVPLTGERKGKRTWFKPSSLQVIHGHIHIDR